ncbi:MAG TPA: DUF3047 domain-containing protein, partial [Methylomirabilota bacterium]|nr:DUF3047 domain-containing protein [Methylomirabilota bacterium]
MKRRRQQYGAGVAVALVSVLLLATGAAILLSNPRHRAFYFGAPGGGLGAVSSATSSPSSSGLVRSAAAPGTGRAVAAALPAPRVPTADGQGRVRVPITDEVPARLPASGVPVGWEMKEFTGDASIETVRDEGRVALRLRSDKTSFALHRDVVLDVRRYPILTWAWKVLRLPAEQGPVVLGHVAPLQHPGVQPRAARLEHDDAHVGRARVLQRRAG